MDTCIYGTGHNQHWAWRNPPLCSEVDVDPATVEVTDRETTDVISVTGGVDVGKMDEETVALVDAVEVSVGIIDEEIVEITDGEFDEETVDELDG